MWIKCNLYKLAVWYIGKCNEKWDRPITAKEFDKLDRLTFRSFGKAHLKYGCDSEWKSFSRYSVLDNAIQKLAEYEDKDTKQ